jgi:hypothetical protein
MVFCIIQYHPYFLLAQNIRQYFRLLRPLDVIRPHRPPQYLLVVKPDGIDRLVLVRLQSYRLKVWLLLAFNKAWFNRDLLHFTSGFLMIF